MRQNVTHDQKNDIDNLINRLNFSSALTAEEYISIDDEEEILSAFEQVEDKDVIDSITTPNVSINEAAKAFETAFNFLEQNNVQADYNELKAFKSLKKKIELYKIQNANQTTITSFFK